MSLPQKTGLYFSHGSKQTKIFCSLARVADIETALPVSKKSNINITMLIFAKYPETYSDAEEGNA